MDSEKFILLLSDATGETVEHMCTAAMTQFRDSAVNVRRIGNVRTQHHVQEALTDAKKLQALVVFTIVNRELAQLVHDECDRLGLHSLDLLTPLLMRISQHLGLSPQEMPGLLHGVDEAYYRRVDAIEFTV